MRWLIAAPSLFERCRNFVLSFFLPFLRAYSQSAFSNRLLHSSRAISFQGSAFDQCAALSQRVNAKKRSPLNNAIYNPILENRLRSAEHSSQLVSFPCRSVLQVLQ